VVVVLTTTLGRLLWPRASSAKLSCWLIDGWRDEPLLDLFHRSPEMEKIGVEGEGEDEGRQANAPLSRGEGLWNRQRPRIDL
jgi:hypothetical protein